MPIGTARATAAPTVPLDVSSSAPVMAAITDSTMMNPEMASRIVGQPGRAIRRRGAGGLPGVPATG